MRRNYDFSKGVRGKFYREGAQLRLPIYLDTKLQKQLERLAQKNGKDAAETAERKNEDISPNLKPVTPHSKVWWNEQEQHCRYD